MAIIATKTTTISFPLDKYVLTPSTQFNVASLGGVEKYGSLNLGNLNVAGTISGSNIAANAIASSHIQAGAITASKISVSSLSAVSGTLGTVSAGSISSSTITGTVITGGTVQTSSTSSDRVVLEGSDNSLRFYIPTIGGWATMKAASIGGVTLNRSLYTTIRGLGFGALNSGTDYFMMYVDGSGYGVLQMPNTNVFRLASSGGATKLSYTTSTETLATPGNFTAAGYLQTQDGRLYFTSGGADYIFFYPAGSYFVVRGHLDPYGQANYNIGGADRYWYSLNYKNLVDRGCLGSFDEGAELQDGRRVSDIEAIKEIKTHPTLETTYGVKRLDYRTMPKSVFMPAADHAGKVYPRDKNSDMPLPFKSAEDGQHYEPQDGANIGALASIMLGALKELDARLLAIENKSK